MVLLKTVFKYYTEIERYCFSSIEIFAYLTLKSNCDTKSVVLFRKLPFFFFLLIHLISHL